MRQSAESLESEISDSELVCLLKVLRDRELKGTHLEIGTASGGTLCRLYSLYRDDCEAIPFFMVIDPMQYFPNQFEKVSQNLQNNDVDHAKIKFMKTTSKEAFSSIRITPPKLDFILIDGNHKIKHVTEDLRWSRHLNQGGILCAHDYTPSHPGVFLSLNRFLKKHKNYKVLNQVESLLILEKHKATPSGVLEISFWDRLWASLRAPWFQVKASLSKRLKGLGRRPRP